MRSRLDDRYSLSDPVYHSNFSLIALLLDWEHNLSLALYPLSHNAFRAECPNDFPYQPGAEWWTVFVQEHAVHEGGPSSKLASPV